MSVLFTPAELRVTMVLITYHINVKLRFFIPLKMIRCFNIGSFHPKIQTVYSKAAVSLKPSFPQDSSVSICPSCAADITAMELCSVVLLSLVCSSQYTVQLVGWIRLRKILCKATIHETVQMRVLCQNTVNYLFFH